MLKKATSGVLVSKIPSTYPRGYASGIFSSTALLDDLFDHPDDHAGVGTLRGVVTAGVQRARGFSIS
jgi:hypothetical protein